MSSGDLGKLVVSLEANIAKFQSDLGRAALISEQAMRRIEERSALTAQAFRTLGGLVAGVFAVGALRSFAVEVIASNASLKDMAETTGASVEQLSGLREVARESGRSMEEISAAMVKLTKNLTGTEDETKAAGSALKALGIPLEQFKRLDPASQLEAIAGRMAAFADGSGKTAVALDLLGKNGASLLPYLKDLAEAGQLNTKVTKEQAEQSDQLEKNLRGIQRASEDLKKNLVNNMVPALNDITAAMKQAAKDSGLLMSLWVGLGGLFAKSTVGQFFNADGSADAIKAAQEQRIELKRLGEALETNERLAKEGDQRAAARIPQIAARMRELLTLSTETADAVRQVFTPDAAAPERPKVSYEGKDKREAKSDPSLQYLNRLMTEYEQLTGGISKYQQAERDLAAMKKDVSPERAREIRDWARLIDQRQAAIKQLEGESRALEAAGKGMEDYSSASADAAAGVRSYSKDLRDQLDSYNLTAEAAAQLAFNRKLDAQVTAFTATAMQAANDGFVSQAQAMKDIADRTREAGQAKILFAELQAKEIEQMRNWQTGATRALDTYARMVADVASQTEEVFSNAFRSMEDALSNFVATGKLDFKSLVQSILADITRMQVRANITGPLSNWMAGFTNAGGSGLTWSDEGGSVGGGFDWGSLLSSIGSLFGGGRAVGERYVPRDQLMYVHEGEEITPKSQVGRAGAPQTGNVFNFYGGVSRNEVLVGYSRAVAQADANRVESQRRRRA